MSGEVDIGFRGDIFGLDNGEVHRFTAEAIVDSTLRLVKRESLERLARGDVAMALRLLTMTTQNLKHVEDHILLLGRKTAKEKVAAFLVEMNGRMTGSGVMALPMTRLDVADYLGLTTETVSRTISELQRNGYMRVTGIHNRDIVVLNVAGLALLG